MHHVSSLTVLLLTVCGSPAGAQGLQPTPRAGLRGFVHGQLYDDVDHRPQGNVRDGTSQWTFAKGCSRREMKRMANGG